MTIPAYVQACVGVGVGVGGCGGVWVWVCACAWAWAFVCGCVKKRCIHWTPNAKPQSRNPEPQPDLGALDANNSAFGLIIV